MQSAHKDNAVNHDPEYSGDRKVGKPGVFEGSTDPHVSLPSTSSAFKR